MLRARQIWGGTVALPGLREALGLAEDGSAGPPRPTRSRRRPHALVAGMEARRLGGRRRRRRSSPTCSARRRTPVAAVLRFAADEVVPRLARTTDEIDAVLHALDGGYVPAGPSGSPLRGLVNVLPTGRNFYSVDPRAIPSRLAWETGQAMAESLLARYRADTGEYPRSVGLSVWGTSAMRTSGDDVAEVLRAARRPPGVGRGVAPGHRPRADPARRARPAADRRHGADQRLLPRRVPARGDHAGRRGAAGRRPGRAGRATTSCARTWTPTSPSTATGGGPPRGSSAPSPAPTGPGCCR